MGFGELPLVVVPQLVLTSVIKDVQPSCKETLNDLVYGLTKWESKVKEKIVIMPKRILTFEGTDHESAVVQMNESFLKNRWSDGLPLLPATEEHVKWLLTGTDRKPDEVVGRVTPRGGIATVEVIATAAAMAGARPEYMPVLIAAIAAITEPDFDLPRIQATTNPVTPLIVVNGPIAKEIGINSSYGCLGPSSEFPAGASIGRAMRLILQNVGGAIPGVTTMATHGQPGRYTGLVIAEDEDQSPWEPVSAERGLAKGTNAVTAFGTMGSLNTCCLYASTELSTASSWATPARMIAYPTVNYFDNVAGVLLITPEVAQGCAQFGWSKKKIKSFLYENARIPWSHLVDLGKSRCGYPDLWKDKKFDPYRADEKPVPITLRPEGFAIVVAGGFSGHHWTWLPGGFSKRSVTKKVELPANWEGLLKEAPKFWAK